jgi:hypothetical protein
VNLKVQVVMYVFLRFAYHSYFYQKEFGGARFRDDRFTQNHMAYDPVLRGMVSDICGMDDMLIPGHSLAWEAFSKLLTDICRGKDQLDHTWDNQ